MAEIWDVLLDALIDTAKILPVLFAVYYLIEILEFKFAKKIANNKLLKGNASPVFGALVGSIPQCGFSVVSTDLFSDGIISVGALIAVYIATSDEAIPIMLSNFDTLPMMCLLIAIKIVYAIVIGYLSLALYKVIFKNKKTKLVDEEEIEIHDGCCHHHVESNQFDWLHPLMHCLKIALFILIINILFGLIVYFVGTENISKFLLSNTYLQPLFAVIVGLIPNCASSVVLTELFIMNNGLKFGALVAGLCVNAGLGLIMLIKTNKNVKENIFIISVLIISGLILGYSLLFI